jgi:FdhE protein
MAPPEWVSVWAGGNRIGSCKKGKLMTKENLTRALKTIEAYKTKNLEGSEILDILGDILVLRDDYKKNAGPGLFEVTERLVKVKIASGFPLLDLSKMEGNWEEPRKYFSRLLEVAQAKGYEEAGELAEALAKGEVDFLDLLGQALAGEPEEGEPSGADGMSFDLVSFLIDESLRPYLELVWEKYAGLIGSVGWKEGYCPVCGEEPKIGEVTPDEDERHLFCYLCSARWSFEPGKCPSCGNEEHQSLAYFSIEGEERYRVEVCNSCRRYVKTVRNDPTEGPLNLEIEDLATLYLDYLAYEEGYN